MPEPSFWQYISGQVPQDVRTWPAECSIPAFIEVHDLLEPQGGVIPLYVYFLLFLCQTFPFFMGRMLWAWWHPEKGPKARSSKRSFAAWFQVVMALWYAFLVTYTYSDMVLQLARCTPEVSLAGMMFYLLCTMPASQLIRPAAVGWMKSYLGYIMPSLEEVEQNGTAEPQPRVQACLLCLTFVPMLLLLGLFSLSVVVTCAACMFGFLGCGIIVIASACFFGIQAAGLAICGLTKRLTTFVEFGAKQAPSFLFCPALVYYGIFVNLQKDFLAVAQGFDYNAGLRIADEELSRIDEFFQAAKGFRWSPLQIPSLPVIHFEGPFFDGSVLDLQRVHDVAFLTILFVDPVLAWLANLADWASHHFTAVAPEPTKTEVKMVRPRRQTQ